MPYVKTNWVAGVTPLSELNMDHLETQYDEALTRVLKTADEIVNNSTVLQNDDELFFPIAANKIWEFRFILLGIATGGGSFRFAQAVPAGAVLQSRAVAFELDPANPLKDSQSSGVGTPIIVHCDNSNRIMVIEGLVVNGANAGNVQLQWCQAVLKAFDTKILRGSCLIAHQLL